MAHYAKSIAEAFRAAGVSPAVLLDAPTLPESRNAMKLPHRMWAEVGKPYVYEPLRAPTNIRLLWVEPGSGEDTISLSLFESLVSELDDQSEQLSGVKADENEPKFVPFVALSYCWGDGKDKVPVWIKLLNSTVRALESKIYITRNLHDFLVRMRKLEEPAGPYWIDAVSIDQENTQGEREAREKDVQVAMMGNIYSSALRADAWLGMGDETIPLAFDYIDSVSKYVVDMYEQFTWWHHTRKYDNSQSGYYGRNMKEVATLIDDSKEFKDIIARVVFPDWDGPSELPTASSSNHEAWKGIAKLFELPWFHRVWTFQEFVLPKQITFLCGPHSLDASAIILFTKIYRLRFHIYGSQPWEPDSPLSIGCFFSACLARYNRQILSAEVSLVQYANTQRWRDASDKRDKLYGLLGVTVHDMKVEYKNKPIATLYTEFAASVIRRSMDFWEIWFLLSSTDLPKRLHINELPTWVPDWSSSGDRMLRMEFRDDFYRHASVGGPFDRPRVSQDLKLLFYKGALFQTVKTIRTLDVEKRFDHGLILQNFPHKLKQALRDANFDLSNSQPQYQTEDEILLRTLTADTLVRDGELIRGPQAMNICSFVSNLEIEEHYPNRAFTTYRLLFQTSGGHLGLGPLLAMPGDFVAVLPGMRTPFLLRKWESRWLMIGACYGECPIRSKVLADFVMSMGLWMRK